MATMRRGRRRVVVAVLGDQLERSAKKRRGTLRDELRTGTRKPPRRSDGTSSEILRRTPKADPYGR
jgi:hypothetical protein